MDGQVFVSVFAALSLVPVLTFLGFCVFAGSVLVGGAAVFVIFWAAVLVSAAGGSPLSFQLAVEWAEKELGPQLGSCSSPSP